MDNKELIKKAAESVYNRLYTKTNTDETKANDPSFFFYGGILAAVVMLVFIVAMLIISMYKK